MMDGFALLDGFLGMAIATAILATIVLGENRLRIAALFALGLIATIAANVAGDLTVSPDLGSANKTIRGVYSLVVIAIAIVAAKRLKIQ
jgi:hypothetical protein